MNDKQIQDIADKVIAALENLAPTDPGFQLANWGPVAVFLAACVAAVVGYKNLLMQQRTLKETVRNSARSLNQKREADARSEWWRRTQWALEATASKDNEVLAAYGTGMLTLLAESELATDKDRDLLDTAWKVESAAADEQSAEEFLAEAEELVSELDVDGGSETGNNGGTKEAHHG
ncbi:hypothetical protein [Arthrobacter sp. Z4-13]